MNKFFLYYLHPLGYKHQYIHILHKNYLLKQELKHLDFEIGDGAIADAGLGWCGR